MTANEGAGADEESRTQSGTALALSGRTTAPHSAPPWAQAVNLNYTTGDTLDGHDDRQRGRRSRRREPHPTRARLSLYQAHRSATARHHGRRVYASTTDTGNRIGGHDGRHSWRRNRRREPHPIGHGSRSIWAHHSATQRATMGAGCQPQQSGADVPKMNNRKGFSVVFYRGFYSQSEQRPQKTIPIFTEEKRFSFLPQRNGFDFSGQKNGFNFLPQETLLIFAQEKRFSFSPRRNDFDFSSYKNDFDFRLNRNELDFYSSASRWATMARFIFAFTSR